MAGFWNHLASYFKSATGSVLIKNDLGEPGWMESKYAAYAREGYSYNPYVYACIRLIATACGGIKWYSYTLDVDGKQQKHPEHKINRLVTRPNKYSGWSSFCERFISHLLIDGNAFILSNGPTTGDNGGKPSELWALRPDRVTVTAGGAEWDPTPVYSYDDGKTGKQPLDSENLLHLWLFHPLDDFRGLSPMSAAAHSIDLNNSERAWNQSLLKNKGVPSGAFVVKGTMSPALIADLRGELEAKFTGQLNAGRPLLLQGDTDWKNLGYNATEIDWLNGIRLTADEVAVVYNVAPELVGGLNRTYANVDAARKALYELNALPMLDMVRDEFNNQIAPKFDDSIQLDYDRDDIEALQEDRKAIFDRMDKASWLKVNEKRQETGYSGDPGGDVILVPGNQLPLEAVSLTGQTTLQL